MRPRQPIPFSQPVVSGLFIIPTPYQTGCAEADPLLYGFFKRKNSFPVGFTTLK